MFILFEAMTAELLRTESLNNFSFYIFSGFTDGAEPNKASLKRGGNRGEGIRRR